ncbi:MAG: hypothetical protein ACRDD7_07790 [Peptostreptococcaceae bacterium]
MGYVDHIRAGQLEEEIRDAEKELSMALLNDREWDIRHWKSELRDLNQELESLYWE